MPDNSKGGRKPRVTDEDILDVLRSTTDPVLSTAEVAEAVPIKRRGTLNRLRSLEDADEVDSKQIGGRNTVWWLAEDVQQTPRETADRTPEPAADQSPTDTPATPTGGNGGVIAEVLDGWPPVGEQKREQRRQAGRVALEYLQEVEKATASDLKKNAEPNAPVDDQSPDTWWKNSARPAFKQAEDAGLVTFTDGSKVWEWVGQ